jgi:hypothetical protein
VYSSRAHPESSSLCEWRCGSGGPSGAAGCGAVPSSAGGGGDGGGGGAIIPRTRGSACSSRGHLQLRQVLLQHKKHKLRLKYEQERYKTFNNRIDACAQYMQENETWIYNCLEGTFRRQKTDKYWQSNCFGWRGSWLLNLFQQAPVKFTCASQKF